MLSAFMLSVVMLSAIMLNVVAPRGHQNKGPVRTQIFKATTVSFTRM